MRTLLPRTGRRLLLASAVVIALGSASIAIAGLGSPASTTLVSATFGANTLAKSHTDTCTPTTGDAYAVADVVFTGVASSADARLAGPITIHAKSVYDSTKNVGSLTGDARIDSTLTPPGHFHAKLTATNVNGLVQGWLSGELGDGSHFMGSFSATFSTTTGFNSGAIGAGNPTSAAIAWNGHCGNPHPNHGHNDKHHHHDD